MFSTFLFCYIALLALARYPHPYSVSRMYVGYFIGCILAQHNRIRARLCRSKLRFPVENSSVRGDDGNQRQRRHPPRTSGKWTGDALFVGNNVVCSAERRTDDRQTEQRKEEEAEDILSLLRGYNKGWR